MADDFTYDDYLALMERAQEGHAGDEQTFACSVDPDDHLHIRRLGDVGEGAEGRVGLLVHSHEEQATVLFSPSVARIIASELLNLADELDDNAPLLFFGD